MEIFTQLKSKLKKEYPTEYEKFIKHLEIDETNSSQDNIILLVPNIFTKNIISRKFIPIIKEFFKEKFQITPNIKIDIKKEEIHKNLKTEVNFEIKSVLLEEYTFDSFIVGKFNEFAYNAALTIAKNPGSKALNPFFLYGGVGLGKTHLLHAIGNYLKNKLKVLYLTSEEFINTFLYSMRNNDIRFREIYRNCDILLIDDIQFLSGKDKTQEEFFHTFNELYSQNKQICITSDRPPKQIPDLVDRLKDRFEWGLTIDIQFPDVNAKIEIIKHKSKNFNLNLSENIIKEIAIKSHSIREIEGILATISTLYFSTSDENRIKEFISKLLHDNSSQNIDNIDLETIICFISKEFNIKPSEILSKNKSKTITLARHCAIYLAKNLTSLNTTAIANFFNFKDHSAVSHNIRNLEKKLNKNSHLKIKLEDLKNRILTESCE